MFRLGHEPKLIHAVRDEQWKHPPGKLRLCFSPGTQIILSVMRAIMKNKVKWAEPISVALGSDPFDE
jgi:hypothetical protein